jgi:hypothetical protein
VTQTAEDATALEAQYKMCAKHYIPSEKCTPEIYQQLKNKENIPLDPVTASALRAVKDYQIRLKNPSSMQLHTAYVTDKNDICLEVGAQNGVGGQSVSRVVFTSKGKWKDEGGSSGEWAAHNGPGSANRWGYLCTIGVFHPKMVPGTDVTEKVNQALQDGRDQPNAK